MPSTLARSFVKGVIWELSGPAILWCFTHEVKVVIGYTSVRIILYFVYERFWKKIRWGKYGNK